MLPNWLIQKIKQEKTEKFKQISLYIEELTPEQIEKLRKDKKPQEEKVERGYIEIDIL